VFTRLVPLAVSLLLVGCGAFTAPKPTAGDFTDIAGGLVRRGMTITNQVGGDAGCGTNISSSLHNNAVRYDVRPPNATSSYPVYVFGWKSEQTYNEDKPTFEACIEAAQQSSVVPIESSEHLPWRAMGPGWPAELHDAVDASLAEAGGIPAPVQPE
jgi:hypothetical protein